MLRESPVQIALRQGPRGNWAGEAFKICYRRIALGCQRMAETKYVYLSQDHIDSMADLGSGHEERMKSRFHWMLHRGYLTDVDLKATR